MGLKPRASIAADIAAFARAELARLADPGKAPAMAAYMKTSMPFYGVQSPQRREVVVAMDRFELRDRAECEAAVLALWRLPHREEKYLAIELAIRRRKLIGFDSMRLYERLIRDGQWWDLVDGVAAHLVGRVVRQDPARAWRVIDPWIGDRDMWIRRTALICQIRLGASTDAQRLFDFCRRRAAEREFFIRKAIGWALREYSKTAPERVREFLLAHRGELSGLSFREAARRIELA